MKIIAGIARGISLSVLPGDDVRPTPDRVRKALCDSLRDFSGLAVTELYAGSGAFGLEAASRGAAAVLLVEKSRRQSVLLQENIDRIKKSGVTAKLELCCTEAGRVDSYRMKMKSPDVIFADPPYAESATEFAALMRQEAFRQWAGGATLIWELPSAGHDFEGFSAAPQGVQSTFRRYEGFNFMIIDL